MHRFLVVAVAILTAVSFVGAVAAKDAKPAKKAKAPTSLTVKMNMLDNKTGGTEIGEVVITKTKYGLVFTPSIKGAVPGAHGFHIHVNADCGANKEGVAGMAAGGHWDPADTKTHSFPWDDKGHKGDLPALYVDMDGNTPNPVLAPKLHKLDELKGHALMIHFGGDNHSDHPAVLGGGGARFACGVIK